MNLRTPLIFYLVVTITLLISLLSIAFPNFANSYGLFLVGILVCFIGIPHGATDNLVFYALNKKSTYAQSIINFYLFYIFSIFIYILSWYLFPSLAFNIFLAVSIYHLGQSNLYYLHLPKKILKTCVYCCWGLFIITAAIVSNPQEVIFISKYLSNDVWLLHIKHQEYFLALIIILNSLIISLFFNLKYLSQKDLIREYLSLIILGILFYTTPLIISFGVYFGLWHSLGSTFDQLECLKKANLKASGIDYYLKSIPISIISIIFLIIIAFFLNDFNIEQLQKHLNTTMASFFIFIASITLPHTIIRDNLYRSISSDG
ncbi:Brp/Blh family beta-carotene 15,15'-dioxygenase [Nostoc sp.]|uniref:Brp/Blh family beta-carotene 15,15'-dioxygenase n=1 Tax=Nostoc sp. TaxID=1180 RepID=UPI002FFC8974